MKKTLLALSLGGTLLASALTNAATYVIDTQGAQASIHFKIKHLGYSWLVGRFNTFSGQFEYDPAATGKSSVEVKIDTASIDSNHAERDKHLRSADFLDTGKFPEASFRSTGFKPTGVGQGELTGDFTLKGVTRSITFPVQLIGEGSDPWGGYRAGFEGSTSLKLTDYGITYNLGPASTEVEIGLHIEGIRQ